MIGMTTEAMALYAGIQGIKYITRRIEAMQKGEVTPEELMIEWGKVGMRLDAANARWDAAGGLPE